MSQVANREWVRPVTLAGRHVTLEPLRIEHADGLKQHLTYRLAHGGPRT